MLREDKKATLVQGYGGFWGGKRWRFFSGTIHSTKAYKEEEILPILGHQMRQAFPVFNHGGRQLWMFRDRFYWEDEGLSEDDVTALALERERKRQRQLERAHGTARAGPSGYQEGRQPIPREVKLAVHERDGGRCVNCGSTALLQFDHVIPVAMGGSNSVQNLQLLCDRCNQVKGASLD